MTLVEAIITKKRPLSLLLFGTLDLDNLDNVARMAFAVGIDGGANTAVRIASELAVGSENKLYLNKNTQLKR